MFDLLMLFVFLFLLCLLFLMLKCIHCLFVVSIFTMSCEVIDLKSMPHLHQMIAIPSNLARHACRPQKSHGCCQTGQHWTEL